MKNCIIVHGCPSDKEKFMDPETRTYDKHWMPWLKRNLEEKGIKAETPLMPDPWEPDYPTWKEEFDKLDINENTILIGHSCGCAFLVRWLGDTDKTVEKLVLVAPWKTTENEEDLRKKEFYRYDINLVVRKNVKEIVIFTADNEGPGGKRSARIFHEALGGRVIELKGHGHYCLNDMGTEEFPELLEEVSK